MPTSSLSPSRANRRLSRKSATLYTHPTRVDVIHYTEMIIFSQAHKNIRSVFIQHGHELQISTDS
jgi:hypothetical protein